MSERAQGMVNDVWNYLEEQVVGSESPVPPCSSSDISNLELIICRHKNSKLSKFRHTLFMVDK